MIWLYRATNLSSGSEARALAESILYMSAYLRSWNAWTQRWATGWSAGRGPAAVGAAVGTGVAVGPAGVGVPERLASAGGSSWGGTPGRFGPPNDSSRSRR